MDNKETTSEYIQAVLSLHLGKNYPEIPVDEQIRQLLQKRKRYWIMIAVNALALIFFSYSFIYGITQLSDWVYYALGTVFVLNVLLIFHQRKQINLAVDYLERQGK